MSSLVTKAFVANSATIESNICWPVVIKVDLLASGCAVLGAPELFSVFVRIYESFMLKRRGSKIKFKFQISHF